MTLSRRAMLGAAGAAAGAGVFTIVPRHTLGGPSYVPPSDRVNLAAIGLGRQGMAVTMNFLARPEVQVVALCDVNRGSKDYVEYGNNALLKQAHRLLGASHLLWGADLASPGEAQLTAEFKSSLGMGGREPARRVVETFYSSRDGGSYKGCAVYSDYRELLEKERGIDAVYIATPDHWHAVIAIAAMRAKKAVLCQKPMAHSIGEARRMAQVARETGAVTALPVNNPYLEQTRQIASWISDGAIGPVREVHNWSSRPYWPQGIARPANPQPVPAGLDWDMWLGPAPERPFHKAYLPFVWRGWYDFGAGSFGDMGCYSFAGVTDILRLTPPTSVEASTSEACPETYPKSSIVRLQFPEHDGRPPVLLTWYDGYLKPNRPRGLLDADQERFAHKGQGILYVGDKGFILADFNGDQPRLYPESPKFPVRELKPRPPDTDIGPAIEQWLAAMKGGPAPLTRFEAQNPVTESFLLGCIAQRLPGEVLQWDSAAARFPNSPKATELVSPPLRSRYRV